MFKAKAKMKRLSVQNSSCKQAALTNSRQSTVPDGILISVAIDFGTTYSGYAFSFKGDFETDPTKIYANGEWPAGNKGFSKKTPTVLLLNPDKIFDSFGFEAEENYLELAPEQHRDWYYFRRFKMKLHGDKKIPYNLQLEDETGKTLDALTVFSESIRYLKDHFLGCLNKTGKVVKESEIQYVLTVPAIWSDLAKQFMRNAAIKAGIEGKKLKIALEPEAAAFFCQHEKTEREDNEFVTAQTGTKYMVVDLGGGTADITVHERLENGKIKEVYQATGGAWGGTAVDEAYIQVLVRIFGGPVIHQFRIEHSCDFLDMLREFEVSKRKVKLEGGTSFRTRIPASLNSCCKDQNDETVWEIFHNASFPFRDKIKLIGDKLSIDYEIIREIFNTVIGEIVDHVRGIMQNPEVENCRLMLLVGGFSESSLVQNTLMANFQTSERRVIVPQDPELTVVKGAVIFGHAKETVSSRVMRYFYGTKLNQTFQEGKHSITHRYRDSDGRELAKNVFVPFIEKGKFVGNSHTVAIPTTFHHFTASSFASIYCATEPVVHTDEEGCEKLTKIHIFSEKMKAYIGQEINIESVFTFGNTEISILIKCKQTGESFHASVEL